ncbi:MAG: SDR family NAD(P)-dependent oxidoreductase, partial [Microbacteriaceae bacterium]|nr:SDR family NAD(P)-dependent oxidoreductase [Microbacteriaceae bacterium]
MVEQIADARVVVITGASRGIGRLLAEKLGAEGAHVVINYKKNADLA